VIKPKWAGDFPRLYELSRDCEQGNEGKYFEYIESALDLLWGARQKYEKIEEELQQLDNDAWQELKKKACKYVASKHKLRGWQQLFNTLNEAKGYLYLKSEGCTGIHFIPEGRDKNPDLYGRCGNSVFVIEVKTINESEDEIDWIQENSKYQNGCVSAREAHSGLDDTLKGKIIKTINAAKEQLKSKEFSGAQRKIVYLVIRLDILVSININNIDKLATYIGEQSSKQIEVKHCLYNY